jgi:hypothetical protein
MQKKGEKENVVFSIACITDCQVAARGALFIFSFRDGKVATGKTLRFGEQFKLLASC